jgi:phosphoribosyl-AMP cyclohydrolase
LHPRPQQKENILIIDLTVMSDSTTDSYLTALQWTAEGLVPAIAQDAKTGRVLMMAWMNREALAKTVATGWAVYWSRSRQALWHKGESSGHRQKVLEVLLDCDADVVLLQIEQEGNIACHTGRLSCFFRVLTDGKWQTVDPILKDPKEIYS